MPITTTVMFEGYNVATVMPLTADVWTQIGGAFEWLALAFAASVAVANVRRLGFRGR